jgi:hypothetical protein
MKRRIQLGESMSFICVTYRNIGEILFIGAKNFSKADESPKATPPWVMSHNHWSCGVWEARPVQDFLRGPDERTKVRCVQD